MLINETDRDPFALVRGEPADPVLVLKAESDQLEEQLIAGRWEEDEAEELLDLIVEVDCRMMSTTATSLAGIIVQVEELRGGSSDKWIDTIIAGLRALERPAA